MAPVEVRMRLGGVRARRTASSSHPRPQVNWGKSGGPSMVRLGTWALLVGGAVEAFAEGAGAAGLAAREGGGGGG